MVVAVVTRMRHRAEDMAGAHRHAVSRADEWGCRAGRACAEADSSSSCPRSYGRWIEHGASESGRVYSLRGQSMASGRRLAA